MFSQNLFSIVVYSLHINMNTHISLHCEEEQQLTWPRPTSFVLLRLVSCGWWMGRKGERLVCMAVGTTSSTCCWSGCDWWSPYWSQWWRNLQCSLQLSVLLLQVTGLYILPHPSPLPRYQSFIPFTLTNPAPFSTLIGSSVYPRSQRLLFYFFYLQVWLFHFSDLYRCIFIITF